MGAFRLVLIVSKKSLPAGFFGAHMWVMFPCRARTRLGKIRALLLPCCMPRVVVLVSVQTVIAPTGSHIVNLVLFSHLPRPGAELYAELPSSPA